VGIVVNKAALGQVFSVCFGFLCHTDCSTNIIIIIYHSGLVQ
jgi:hypothetical protein